MKTGIIIARFQSARVTKGISEVIELVRAENDEAGIVLGESKLPSSAANPLSVESRKAMLKDSFREIPILHLRDHPLDETWSEKLDELIVKEFPGESIVLYGHPERFVRRYSGRFTTKSLPDRKDEEKKADEQPDNAAFRQGVMYAHASAYSRVLPTVDVAVFRNSRSELLLGRKAIDKKWRLIGGFSDPDDASFEEAAKRELAEECGPIGHSPLHYEGSFRIDDWRYRLEKDKIITTLFSCDLTDGSPEASDDIEAIDWFGMSHIRKMVTDGETAREHQPLFEHLLKVYSK